MEDSNGTSHCVFISYDEADVDIAKRLYDSLSHRNIPVWFDKNSLLPGQHRKATIRKAIRTSRFFIPLFSPNSATRGRVIRETKWALEDAENIPASDIHIIPARIAECPLPMEALEQLVWANLFCDWTGGVEKILQAIDSQSNVTSNNHSLLLSRNRGIEKETSPKAVTIAPNPFGDVGRIDDPSRFFDRQELMRRIFEELEKGGNISLVGDIQIGKSSVLSMVCNQGRERLNSLFDAFVYLDLQLIEDEKQFFEELCLECELPFCRGAKLARALKAKHCMLCLDEIEKMTWTGFTQRLRSFLRGLADGSNAPVSLVIASRTPLENLFPDSPKMTSPLAGICIKMDLTPFSLDTARSFLRHRLQGTGVTFSEKEMDQLIVNSGGHPFRLQAQARAFYEKYRNRR